MFNSLSEKLESAFKHLKGQARINELNVANTLKDIRKALLDADVNFKIAKEFTDSVKEKAIGAKVINAISPGQLMVKIVQDELTTLMGSEASLMDLSKSPTIILVAGLQGSGKTTFSGKLANYLKAQKKSPLLVAADIYRPAAMDQLTLLASQVGVDVFVERENKNAVSIAQNALVYAKANNKNVVIIDTAGRLAVDEVMMNEVAAIKNEIQPQEILFVVDAMTDRKSTRLNSSHIPLSRMPSSA